MTEKSCTPPPSVLILYRISDLGCHKNNTRLENATKEHCLLNAAEIFGKENFYIIADNCSDELIKFIQDNNFKFECTSLGNSKSFKYALTKAIKNYDDEQIIYFLEDDFVVRVEVFKHKPLSTRAD